MLETKRYQGRLGQAEEIKPEEKPVEQVEPKTEEPQPNILEKWLY